MARLAVTVVSPRGYAHSAAFREVAESLHHGLSALGHDVILTDEVRPVGRRPILLGSNLLTALRQKPAKDAILYNLEQVEPGSPWITPELLALFRRHTVWDYSARNASRYAALGLPPPRVVPIGYAPALTRIVPAPEEDIDVLFYGSVNPRRRAILSALAAEGLRVEAAYGVYGEGRDRLIARARVVLNVHFYEAKVFEIVRVSYLLANRKCVVSERGAEPEEERPFEEGVAFAPYDALVRTCARLVQDAPARAGLAARGHDIMKGRDAAAFLREALEDRPASPVPHEAHAPELRRSNPMARPVTPPLSLEDVLSMTVPAGKRVLDVACGDGQLGAELLRAGAAEVVGLDPCARTLTRSRLTAVFVADADAAPELPYPDGYFDVVLVEDLSRLLVPGPTLKYLRRWLSDQGRLVCVAMNAGHEAALAGLILDGRLAPDAGARAMTPRAALDAIASGGYQIEDDVILQRTEPGTAAGALRQAALALGADPARVDDDLTLARALLAARPTPSGQRQPPPFPDPWRGSRPVKVLLAPDTHADRQWIAGAEALARGLEGNGNVTVGIALPQALLENPPADLRQAMEGLRVDVLLTEAPSDAFGWQRIAAGASTMVAPPPALLPLVRLVGLDVQQVR